MKAGRLTCRGARRAVSPAHRRLRQERAGDQRDRRRPTRGAGRGRRARSRASSRAASSGPLHCVPTIVKDNFETIGLQSANGSLALEGFVSSKDAFQVKRIKDAGAIVLAKSNMAEWAFTPYETVSSILPGYTKNPYALDRVTAGSSGGTAAAVAASFGAIGLGSDTGNSIRGPSSHQALVGIRSTMGLTSRAGVMPLNLLADIAGPMARTVEDAVAVFQVDRRRRSRRPGDGRGTRSPATQPGGHRTIADYALAARRAEGRAHRRAAPGLRARHDRSRDRRRCSWRRSRT